MDQFIDVIKKDPFVCMKINIMLDRYVNLIQNIILKELKNIMSIMILDLDMELKMKISRIKYLESNFSLYKWRLYISLKRILNAML